MKNLAIIGDGKMGRRIYELAGDFGFKVVLQLGLDNNKNGSGITRDNFKNVDAAIDFSHPDVVKTHISGVAALGVPLVVGTTGWLDNPEWVESVVKKHNARIIYGSNFSLGVQLFIKLTQYSAGLFGKSPDFDASLHEIHHTGKADAPSGTALTIANKWTKHSGNPQKIVYGIPQKGTPKPDEFKVTSQRTGSVFGEHSIRINSVWDDIDLTHRARSRDGFAAGALKTAQWILNQKNSGFYLIEDIVEDVLKH